MTEEELTDLDRLKRFFALLHQIDEKNKVKMADEQRSSCQDI